MGISKGGFQGGAIQNHTHGLQGHHLQGKQHAYDSQMPRITKRVHDSLGLFQPICLEVGSENLLRFANHPKRSQHLKAEVKRRTVDGEEFGYLEGNLEDATRDRSIYIPLVSNALKIEIAIRMNG